MAALQYIMPIRERIPTFLSRIMSVFVFSWGQHCAIGRKDTVTTTLVSSSKKTGRRQTTCTSSDTDYWLFVWETFSSFMLFFLTADYFHFFYLFNRNNTCGPNSVSKWIIVNMLILLHRYCNSMCPYGVNILFFPFIPYKYLISNALFLLINMIFHLFSLYRFCNYANVSTVGLIKVFFYSILLMQHLLWKKNTWMDELCCSWINNVILKFAFFLFQTFYKPCKIHCFPCREPEGDFQC